MARRGRELSVGLVWLDFVWHYLARDTPTGVRSWVASVLFFLCNR